MKKLIAAALALTMTLGMSTTALAAGNVDGAGVGSQDPIDVTAKYNDDATEPTVYSVDLTWHGAYRVQRGSHMGGYDLYLQRIRHQNLGSGHPHLYGYHLCRLG